MRSRRKTLPVVSQCSGMEIPQSQVGTPWRQMTITESFKLSKPKPFKMEKPFFVTNVCIEIDSDSDLDTPPQIKYEEADATTRVENRSNNPDRTMISDDPISSTSLEMDIMAKSKRVEKASMNVADKASTFENDVELLGMSMTRQPTEQIEENVDDLASDLESLLGESTASFSLPFKVTEAQDKTEGAPSPPKIPKMIGVYKPGSSSQKMSPKKIISPATPNHPGADSPNTLNAASPHSIGSNSSSKTVRYEYNLSNNSIGWDEDTVPFPLNSEYALRKNNNEEVLVMNFEENASESILSPIQDNSQSRSGIVMYPNGKIPAAKRLDFSTPTDNSNAPLKKERKKRAPKKNKTTDSVQQNQNGDYTNNVKIPPKKPRGRKRKNETESNNNDQKNNGTSPDQLGTPDKGVAKNVHSAMRRKRKSKTESNNNNQKSNNVIQDNYSVDQNVSTTQKAIAKNIRLTKGRKRKNLTETNDKTNDSIVKENLSPHPKFTSSIKMPGIANVQLVTLIPPFKSSADQAESIEQASSLQDNSTSATTQIPCRDMVTTSAGRSVKVSIIAAETIRKGSSSNYTKKTENLTGIIDKLRANNELSFHLVEIKRNEGSSQNLHPNNVGPPVGNTTASATLISNPNTPSKRRSSNINGAIITPDQTLGKTIPLQPQPHNIAEVISKTTVESKANASSEIIQVGVEKSKQKDTPRKTVDEDQRPLCSKSLVKENKYATLEKLGHNGAEKNQPKNTPRKTVIVDQRPVCSKSLTNKNSYDTLEKQIQDGVEKNKQKDTEKKSVVDDQRPVCSKSLTKENSYDTLKKQIQDGVEKNKQKDTQRKTVVDDQRAVCSQSLTEKNSYQTPEKQKMGPNTPSKNTSPKKKLFRSPHKYSPTKNREIKTLKSKEGKQLQVKQMDELVKLFYIVDSNRHLKTLLISQEREILQKFLEMEDNKKYFLMKLFVWKRLWYNIFNFCNKAKIKYEDEKDIIDIFEYLRKQELVDTEYTSSANLLELLNTLDVVKVKEIMEERRIKPIKTKAENIKAILAAAGQQATLTSKSFKDLIMESIQKKLGFAIKIKEVVSNAFYNAYLLATFTNPAFYKIEDYFNSIVHLGVVFPETHIELYLVFHSRDKFLKYGQALKLRTELDEQFTNKNKESKFMGIHNIAAEAYDQLLRLDTDDTDDYSEAPHLKIFTAQHVYTGILSACCEKMYTKQNGKPNEVKQWLEYLIKTFPNSRRLAKWCELLIVLHMRHLDSINYEAGANILIGLLQSKNPVVGDIARHDLGKLGNQLKSSRTYKIDQINHDRITQLIPRSIADQNFPQVTIASRCIRSDESGRKRKYISKSIEGMTVRNVEQVALEHYADNGYPGGEHCEGSLIKALLMLFFWDIIYNPTKNIPGTFLSKLQVGPLDMWTPHFYRNRMELIDERLEEIDSKWSDDKLIDFAANNWHQHVHERAAFSLDVIADKPTVAILITVIGRKVLAKIFKRLIKNIREFGSGMPDLLVWNIDTKQCKFVEVKGEHDRLSTGQKLWLQYLEQSNAVIEVCHVHSTGSKPKKLKTKAHVEHEPQKDKEVGGIERPED